jgi:glycosyltransferase involved in cell wall biosynthesis
VAQRSAPAFTHWLRSAQPGWHLGLAPLLGTRAGGSVRVLEYAALGMPVLASDVAPYRRSVADGAAGELVTNTPAAWLAALDWMIRDEAHRHALAAQARGAFERRGTLGAAAAEWRAALLAAFRPRVRRRRVVTL